MTLIPELVNDPKFKFSIPEPGNIPLMKIFTFKELVTNTLIQLVEVSFGYSAEKLLYTGK